MPMKKIAVITVNLNNLEGLKRTFESLDRQTSADFERIVIDGGSTDGSAEFIEREAGRLHYWVSEPDGGIYEGMNKGIAQAGADYVLFLNSGDRLAGDDVLARANAALGEADIYVGGVKRPGEAPRAARLRDAADVVDRLLFSAFPHQSVFLRRNLFERFGPYRTEYRITADWCHNMEAVVGGNASVKPLDFVVSEFDTTGVSSLHPERMQAERAQFMAAHPALGHLCGFYTQNAEMVRALRSGKISFAIVRLLFFLRRKFQRRRSS